VNLFAPTYLDFLPDWLRLALGIADILIRLAALFWLPYNRKPVVALGWLMAIFFIPFVGFIAFLVFGSSRLPAYRRARQHAMNDMIRRQYRGGTRVALLARLVQDLNGRLFEQAWQLIAPPELVQNSCLLAMGSEGRGEQLLKTDQDNALLLRDGYVPPDDLPAICARFSEALARFGSPRGMMTF